jgi:hypothetical protein
MRDSWSAYSIPPKIDTKKNVKPATMCAFTSGRLTRGATARAWSVILKGSSLGRLVGRGRCLGGGGRLPGRLLKERGT